MRDPPVMEGWSGFWVIMKTGMGAGAEPLLPIDAGWNDEGAGDAAFTSTDVRLRRSPPTVGGVGELITTLFPMALNVWNPACALADAKEVRLLASGEETVGASCTVDRMLAPPPRILDEGPFPLRIDDPSLPLFSARFIGVDTVEDGPEWLTVDARSHPPPPPPLAVAGPGEPHSGAGKNSSCSSLPDVENRSCLAAIIVAEDPTQC